MKFGHKINLESTSYDEKGRGVGQIPLNLPLTRETSDTAEPLVKGAGRKAPWGPRPSTGDFRTIIVPFAAIGDELEATFVKRDYGVKICKLDKIVKAGPDRVDAVCQHAGTCGGCLWQHLSYDAQLAEKERGIHELFANLGLESALKPIIPADETLGYRNRMDYCIGWNGEIGLKEYGSWNKYVDVKECYLMQTHLSLREKSPTHRKLRMQAGVASDEAIHGTAADCHVVGLLAMTEKASDSARNNNPTGRILQIIREFMSEFDLQPWDAKFHTGDMRHVVIRDGQNTKQRMIILVVKDASRITDKARKYLIDKLESHCTSLLIGELTVPTDISLAERFETLIGEPWLEENVNDITYRIHPNSFFQTNSAMAAKLQSTVLDALSTFLCHSERNAQTKGMKPRNPCFDSTEVLKGIPPLRSAAVGMTDRGDDKVLLDLYCGLGFFGIAAAKSDKGLKVWGYELDEEAINLRRKMLN
ncbi:MAG: hypothetical protein WCT54_02875 [Patescibacteria group bacterium]